MEEGNAHQLGRRVDALVNETVMLIVERLNERLRIAQEENHRNANGNQDQCSSNGSSRQSGEQDQPKQSRRMKWWRLFRKVRESASGPTIFSSS